MRKISDKKRFGEVGPRVNSDELEREILKYWEQEKIFEESLKISAEKPLFTFFDGPPYATGAPHYGHVLQSAIKDTVLRYKSMRGWHVPRRVGWDCHGLPVETLVEKELGFKGKREIEEYGIEKFNAKCRETVFRYIDVFTDTLKRMGRWAEYEKAYATLDIDYMESEWWVFKQLWDKDLVYKAFRSTPYCIRCATPLSNFEVSMAYKDKVDTAVYVLLPFVGVEPELSLLIWTTTPWTLPGNVAVAYSADPKVKYVVVKYQEHRIVVAKERVDAVFGSEGVIEQEISGEELAKMGKYKPLYPEVAKNLAVKSIKIFNLVPAEHVTTEEGTGLVHMAPAFGEEDAEVGRREGLPIVRTVDTQGKFESSVSKWQGQNIFKANSEIVKDLEERGLLFKQEEYTHSYPFCWRCDEPLIYYALDSWFVKISSLKSQMLKNNEKIHWIPEHVKKGRFGKGIEAAPDWAVSRNRYWSVPLPVWECDECEERVCVGSIKELQELSGERGIKDLHRPYVDEITWRCVETPSGSPLLRGRSDDGCPGMMKRVSEVLDVWFDAGSMPYSQWHYPWENQALVRNSLPADFIVESVEQTRSWFYVLHVLATALTRDDIGLGKDLPAYKNVIASGLIFAEDGNKLSKKLKNYPDIEPTLKNYGADVLRLYLLSSTALGEPYRFSEKDMRQVKNSVYMTLWNVYSFFVRYALTHEWQPSQMVDSDHVLDKWVQVRMKEFQSRLMRLTEDYQIDAAAREIPKLINDISNWYVRRSRQRFQQPGSDREKNEAFSTLYEVLIDFVKLSAAYMPFVTEAIYRNLEHGKSVHLEQLPDPVALTEDENNIMGSMTTAREAVSEVLAIRAGRGIKVRQPLSKMMVAGESWGEEIDEIVRDEVNVKLIEFVDEFPPSRDGLAFSGEDSRIKVALDLVLSDELKQEGLARELVRQGQVLRREAGFELNDRIVLMVETDNAELRQAFKDQKDFIMKALQADDFEWLIEKPEMEAVTKIDKVKVPIGLRRK